MIDTHCHLNFSPMVEDVPSVLQRAWAAGVTGIVIPGTDSDSSFSAVNIARLFPGVYPAVGIHPSEVEKLGEDADAEIRELAELSTVVAIGEVGLDYHYFEGLDAAGIERVKFAQKALFTDMIQIAQEVQKPLIIHSRDCFEDIYEHMAAQVPNHPAVIHCFTGSIEEAKQWLELGYLLSFTGVITYKKNEALREIVKHVPIEQMMIETDAPYLAPEGFRKESCEPKFVRNVAECVAEVKGVSLEEVIDITTETATSFFNIAL